MSEDERINKLVRNMRKAAMDIKTNKLSEQQIKLKYGHLINFLDEIEVSEK